MLYTKESLQAIKSEIIKSVEKQKFFKNQRKTVHLVGQREIPTWQAASSHYSNRIRLRYLYIAYGIMRGKSIEQIEGKSSTPYSEKSVESILSNYEKALCN